MKMYKKLWIILAFVLVGAFSVLGYFGKEVYHERPPIPARFVDSQGNLLFGIEEIMQGQSAWQSIGGMSVGSIWGHGAYQAPDWTADWLHREVLTWLENEAEEVYGKPYDMLSERDKAALSYDASVAFRTNTYDAQTDTVVLSDKRLKSIEKTADYYDRLFSADPEFQKLRASYAMKEDTLPSATARANLNAFIFWSAWAASTNRPGQEVTYTNNWPHEPLIGNVPTPENVIWSIASVVALIFGIGLVIWVWAFCVHDETPEAVQVPARDPLSLVQLTPSQKALGKYLLIVAALFVLQVFLGGFTAHYTVEGQDFYGIPVADWLPYSLTRTWHIQSAIFWIATGFLAAGLFLVPIINGGKDPKFQKLGVDILFCALIVVVAGSFLGQFVALKGWMNAKLNFYLGHQGYEYVEIGRLWQLALFVGLVFWLILMLRGIWAALKVKGDKSLLILFTMSAAAIGVFYAPAFFYGEHTHLSIMEYWRWWVVHLWVEGFFEVFATTAVGFIFYNLGLVSKRAATTAALLAAMLFLIGGIPGTFHHLYFSGTTTPVMAVGAMFSALEVVPLVLLGYEAFENWSAQHKAEWMRPMRWPLTFFIAVSFWNMLGAGVFGFLINPPIALYYLQGLNTTPNHGHAALFGVYGFLALGFCLMVLRYIRPNYPMNSKVLGAGFVLLNLGLVLMLFTSLLPIGVIQAHAAITEGLWWARSAEFVEQTPIIHTLRWVRTIGDVIFIAGALCFAKHIYSGVFYKEKAQ